jgi:hypothetical protein
VRQIVQPKFTAEMFKINDEKAWPVVRELGIANLGLAVVGLASLAKPSFRLPVAIIAATFYGGAALQASSCSQWYEKRDDRDGKRSFCARCSRHLRDSCGDDGLDALCSRTAISRTSG